MKKYGCNSVEFCDITLGYCSVKLLTVQISIVGELTICLFLLTLPVEVTGNAGYSKSVCHMKKFFLSIKIRSKVSKSDRCVCVYCIFAT